MIKYDSENEFLKAFLPEKHTEADVIYLKARFKWEKSKTQQEVAHNWKECVTLYQQTSFKAKNFA